MIYIQNMFKIINKGNRVISIHASLVSNVIDFEQFMRNIQHINLDIFYNFEHVFVSSVYNSPILAHCSIFIPNVSFLSPWRFQGE